MADETISIKPNRRATVLVVESDPDIRTLLKVALDWQGYKVVLAQNGPEGLLIRSKNPPFDAIVCDTDTPATEGLAFIEKVDLLAPEARIIAFTSRGEKNLRKAKAFGVVRAALSKPCLIANFWSTLERVISEGCRPRVIKSLTASRDTAPATLAMWGSRHLTPWAILRRSSMPGSAASGGRSTLATMGPEWAAY